MAPRTYRMDRRRAATEETRRRIVEATLALHSEKGIFGTSWKEIAERADVSVATVYKHFPSLDELVPACGDLILAITDPPSRENPSRIFGDATSPTERLGRLVSALFDFYARAEPYMEVGPKERLLPAVQRWETEMQATRVGLVQDALSPLDPGDLTIRAISAVLAFPVYQVLRRHDVSKEEAEQVAFEMLRCWISAASRSQPRRDVRGSVQAGRAPRPRPGTGERREGQ